MSHFSFEPAGHGWRVALALALLFPAAADAQEPAARDTARVKRDTAAVQTMPELITTVTRQEQPLSRLPRVPAWCSGATSCAARRPWGRTSS